MSQTPVGRHTASTFSTARAYLGDQLTLDLGAAPLGLHASFTSFSKLDMAADGYRAGEGAVVVMCKPTVREL
jgi:hypothetical protein